MMFFLFRLGAVMCMGVTAGAYILTLFAVSCIPSLGIVYMLRYKVNAKCLFWTLGVLLIWGPIPDVTDKI